MQHVIRLERDDGTEPLWIGDLNDGFGHPQLGLAGNELPEPFTKSQKRLEAAMADRAGVWTMTFQNTAQSAGPLVSFGRQFRMRDAEVGGELLTFSHTVALNEPEHLYPCVKAILGLLSPTSLQELKVRLHTVAQGTLDAAGLCHWLAKALEARASLSTGSAKVFRLEDRFRIDSVVQDCAGGWNVAWLTLAGVVNGSPGNWEVYDETGDHSRTVITTLHPAGGGARARASDLLSRGVQAVLGEQRKRADATIAAASQPPSQRQSQPLVAPSPRTASSRRRGGGSSSTRRARHRPRRDR